MEKIQSFDDWNLGANPEKGVKEKAKAKSPNDALVTKAKELIKEKPSDEIEDQVDELADVIKDVKRTKRKTNYNKAEKKKLKELIVKLRNKLKKLKKAKRKGDEPQAPVGLATTHEQPKVKADAVAVDEKKEAAIDIVVGAKDGRVKERFQGFETWFLEEWANAINSEVPYWTSQNGDEHRTLNGRKLKGTESEVNAHKQAEPVAAVEEDGTNDPNLQDDSFSEEQIKKMQQWMYDNGNSTVKEAIEFTGGVDGEQGPGFYKAFNFMVTKGILNDMQDLLTKTMDVNQFKVENKPHMKDVTSTNMDTSGYDINN